MNIIVNEYDIEYNNDIVNDINDDFIIIFTIIIFDHQCYLYYDYHHYYMV